MSYIKQYWKDKEKRAIKANNHTKKMNELFSDEINLSIRDTIMYNPDFASNKPKIQKDCNIIIDDIDSVSAIFKYRKDKTAVLNFSSYKNAGGMFIKGSKAQEECLCHESFLYNVLTAFKENFYHWNCKYKNKALYLNRCLYSPDIKFIREDNICKCDVITCACPNKSSAQKYLNVSDMENSMVLKNRIRFVLEIAAHNNVNTLILGAYGCGVFGQSPEEVAKIFKYYLDNEFKCFNTVIFAIPNGREGNYLKFKKTFS